MLIITDRHTSQDLESWKDYDDIDRISEWSLKKMKQSIDVMRGFLLSNEKSCVMCSWGKDSIVLLDLFIRSRVNRPVIYMRFEDRANPDCDLVRDAFLLKHDIDYHEEVFNYKEVRKGDKHWKILHEKYGKRCSGIRNDESRVRTIQWYVNGFSSDNSCRPLSLWISSEIFAYIRYIELPLSPVYGYLGGGRYKREHLRTHSLAGTTGNGMGRTEWELEYYPDVLARIAKMENS
jgi:3'-phosphoadenosine 5'-phosphosulfate sulfotransferase (PAPS reductase)/FAD synthetase